MSARTLTKTRDPDEAPRPRLNREQIVRTAVARADREGIDALSMRSLAQDLGVVPMALYKHIAHKEELLDRMVDQVFEELEFPVTRDEFPVTGEWKAALRERAISMREALLRHPWALGLIELGTPGPANLQYQEGFLQCLRVQADLSFAAALHAHSLVHSYIYGYVHQQNAMPVDTAAEAQTIFRRIAEQHRDVAVAYPHMAELLTELGRSGYDYGEEFRFGLELLLDGIERIRLRELSSR